VETNSPEQSPTAAEDDLAAALARHEIALPAEQVAALEAYARLLWEWNEKLNLTRHTTWEKFVARDVVDARQLAEQIPAGERVLDVGTGGGVPGILLAIMRPDLRVELCDPVGKKARAVAEIIAGLGLSLPVHAERAERILERQRFDTLVVRAVAPLWELLSWLAPHWQNIGQLLVIKGPKWLDERGQARHRGYLKPLELRKVAEYPLPGTESNSVILKVWQPEAAV
jgi:16S rRNA (guanine527-N7)-methyltransferase